MKNKCLTNIQSILFDMDGVVVDSMIHHAHSWQTVLREHGININKHDIYKREGMTGLKSIQEIFQDYGLPIPDDDEIYNIIGKKHKIFETIKIDLFPKIIEILSLIKDKNKSIALVTGSLRRSVEYMLPENLISEFNVIITADDVKKGKPDPEPYNAALKKLFQSPENSLVIENAPMGILSAKNACLTCYAIETTLPVDYLNSADLIFKTHEDLYEHLVNNL